MVEVVTKKKSPKQAIKSTVQKLYKNKLEDHWSKRRTSRKNRQKAVQRPFTENNLCREVGLNSSLKLKVFTISLPAEATHTTPDFCEKQPLLVTFDNVSRNNDGDLRTGNDATNTDSPYLSNNALHSLFSECTVSANGVKIFNTNGNYAHKAFIETEFLSGKTTKNTSLVSQGYYYEDDPAKIDGTEGCA